MRGGMEGVWGGEEGEGGVMGLKEWGGLRSGVRGVLVGSWGGFGGHFCGNPVYNPLMRHYNVSL